MALVLVGRPREYEPDRVNTQVRFPRALYAKLRAEADERGVSVNRLVLLAVSDFLSRKRP